MMGLFHYGQASNFAPKLLSNMNTLLKLIVAGNLLLTASLNVAAQQNESTVLKMEQERENKFSFGGYGQLDYNQRVSSSTSYAGKLDPHRFVLFMGYQFAPKIHLISELEVEHGDELYLEQAYLNVRLNKEIQFRGGVMLIPMGLTNEFHEPTTFNGVERPSIANILIPTTWREMGVGVHGRFDAMALSYQAYVFTGFNGYDTQARLTGKDAFRKGRQKALNSYITSPNFSTKVNYYGINNLNIGLAGYFGKSQSKMFDKLDKDSQVAQISADSSVIDIAMIGLDAQYKLQGFELRGEYIHTFIGNTEQYNSFKNQRNDLGSQMQGWYLEASYDLFHSKYKGEKRLIPFVRYENYNTHQKVSGIEKNPNYHFTELFFGLGYAPANGVMLKADYQLKRNPHNSDLNENWINCGIAFTL